jgi:hypothetical protein
VHLATKYYFIVVEFLNKKRLAFLGIIYVSNKCRQTD